jgi:hypothetical protein
MTDFSAIVTTLGQAALAASAGGAPLALTHMQIGDGNGAPTVPSASQTTLVRQVDQIPIDSVTLDPSNPNWLIVRAIVPTSSGPYTIREIGVRSATGDLIAVANYPATLKALGTQGVMTDLTIEMVIAFVGAANVTLTVDPAGLASRAWVINYVAERAPPAFASEAEHVAGERSDRMAHPAGVSAMMTSRIAAALRVRPPIQLPFNGAGLGQVLADMGGQRIHADLSARPLTQVMLPPLTGGGAVPEGWNCSFVFSGRVQSYGTAYLDAPGLTVLRQGGYEHDRFQLGGGFETLQVVARGGNWDIDTFSDPPRDLNQRLGNEGGYGDPPTPDSEAGWHVVPLAVRAGGPVFGGSGGTLLAPLSGKYELMLHLDVSTLAGAAGTPVVSMGFAAVDEPGSGPSDFWQLVRTFSVPPGQRLAVREMTTLNVPAGVMFKPMMALALSGAANVQVHRPSCHFVIKYLGR